MTQVRVSITRGIYRGEVVSGVFTLVKGYTNGAKGGYVTIRNPDHKPGTPMEQRV